jgi:hypothetical protein
MRTPTEVEMLELQRMICALFEADPNSVYRVDLNANGKVDLYELSRREDGRINPVDKGSVITHVNWRGDSE